MAWINFAVCFFLASCFLSTSAIFYDCSLSSMEMCNNMQAVEGETDLDVLCSHLRTARICFGSIETSCLNNDTMGLLPSVQLILTTLQDGLSVCPDEGGDEGPSLMSFSRFGDDTTEEAHNMSEPTSSAEPHGACSWYSARQCSENVDTLDPYASVPEKCEVWEDALLCFQSIEHTCYESDIQEYVQGTVRNMEHNMEGGVCDGTTTHHPRAEPSTETSPEPNNVCGWDYAYACDDDIESLSYYASASEKCYEWNRALHCYETVYQNCYDYDLKEYVEQRINDMHYELNGNCYGPTTHHPIAEPSPGPTYSCDWHTADSCDDDVESLTIYSSESDRCYAWKNALKCYRSLYQYCYEDDLNQFAEKGMDQMRNMIDGNCYEESTTHYPTAEPHGMCDWDKAYTCGDGVDNLSYYASEPDKCYAWKNALECYRMLLSSCYESDVHQFISEKISHMHTNMDGTCHGTTPHYPSAEPSIDPSPEWNSGCDWNTAYGCDDQVESMGYYSSPSEKCYAWNEALECYEHILRNCHDYSVNDYVREMSHDMRDKVEEHCHATTTHYPYPEPHDACNKQRAEECASRADQLSPYTSLPDKCNTWKDAVICLESIKDNCYDYDLQSYVSDKISQWRFQMEQSCYDMTTHYPNAEPHMTTHYPNAEPHSDECTWESYQTCSKPMEGLQYESDPYKICSTYRKGKDCLESFVYNCYEDDMRNAVQQMLQGIDTAIRSYCDDGDDHYDKMCKREDIYECLDDLNSAYTVEKKCRGAGKAKDCLHDLKMCTDSRDEDMSRTYQDYMEQVHHVLNECTYGNMDGSGSLTGDGHVDWRSSFATSACSSHMVILLALMMTLVANMFVKQF